MKKPDRRGQTEYAADRHADLRDPPSFIVHHTNSLSSTLYEMSNVPIWARPPPGSRKPRFTRDQIAAAALAITDKEGFDALSMRRIAEALGAGTMTLYYYVRTKDDLLSLMSDALMAEVVAHSTPLPGHWRAALETIAHATRDTFARHPWALHELEGVRSGGPNELRHIEHSLAAVESLPLPVAVRLELISIVDDFVFGSVLSNREQLAIDPSATRAINDLTKQHLSSGDYPHLESLIAGREPSEAFVDFATKMAATGRFERGLAMLLDGFAAKYGLPRRHARPGDKANPSARSGAATPDVRPAPRPRSSVGRSRPARRRGAEPRRRAH